MEIVKSGSVAFIANWKVSATCHCQTEVIVGIGDVWNGSWLGDDDSRRSGPMFQCPVCGEHNAVTLGRIVSEALCLRIPPDMRAWQMRSGSDRVKSPSRLMRLRSDPSSWNLVLPSVLAPSPASRLLDACVSALNCKFTHPHDVVMVEIATACGDEVTLNQLDTTVLDEVVRRLKRQDWVVSVIREKADAPPQSLRLSGDLERLEFAGWLKR